MAATAQGTSRREVSFERERGVYDVRVTPEVAHVAVEFPGEEGHPENDLRVFRALADASIPIFLIKLHRTAVTFAVAETHVPEVEACMDQLAYPCTVRRDLAIVSVIASSMRDLIGVMASIADALSEAGARTYAIGDSHNSVQCLIDGQHVEAAVERLRFTFGLEGEGD